MTDTRSDLDPRGLIREAYRIEGITEKDCRTIFLDWALGHPRADDMAALLPDLMEQYGTAEPEHPMTAVIREGLEKSAAPVRRTGRARRRSQD